MIPAALEAWALLKRFWWLPVIAGLAVALGVQQLTIARQGASIARYGAKMQHAADVMTITAERIRAARAEARAKDLAHARDTEAAQSKVTDNASTSYQRDIADLRARFDRLRNAPAAPLGSDGRGAGLPTLPYATGGLDGAPGQEGLSRQDAFIASAQAIQLEHLQDWVRQQAAVPR